MTPIQLIQLNFEEIRRRSLQLWHALPPAYYSWRPDEQAMGSLEMIRHVLEGEHLFHQIVLNRGNLGDYKSPWEQMPYSTVENEITFAAPYRVAFLDTVMSFSDDDLSVIEIIRTEKGQRRRLGDYLQRIAYHEAVHAGQLLSYFRSMRIERPLIWD